MNAYSHAEPQNVLRSQAHPQPSACRPPETPDTPEQDAPRTTTQLPAILRYVGAVAILASAVIYMLQGLQHSDIAIRQWVYLAMMIGLGIGGIFSFRFMQDNKGARLFFGLGALIIPVQFSQVGGMVLNYLLGDFHGMISQFQISAPSLSILLIISALTTVVALGVSTAALNILARSNAKLLTLVYLGLNLAILIPLRDSLFGSVLVLGFIAASFTMETKIFRQNSLYKSFEGLSVRLMFLIPTTIVMVRGAFHFSEFLGLGAFALCAAFFIQAMGRSDFVKKGWQDLVLLVSYGFTSFGLLCATFEFSTLGIFHHISLGSLIYLYTVPLLASTLFYATISPAIGFLYRLFATIILGFTCCVVILEPSSAGTFLLLNMGLAFAYFGYYSKHQLPMVAGCIAAALGLYELGYAILENADINLWLTLAIGGLIMLCCSSVLEKHGKRWIGNSKHIYGEFRQWNF